MDLFSSRMLFYCPYKLNSIIFENSIAGTYTLDVKINGKYEIYVIGAGGGGDQATKHSRGGTGGSGAAFVGTVKLTKGLYTIRVGGGGECRISGGTSQIGELILASGGERGYTDSRGGVGGSLTINPVLKIISTMLQANGNAGSGWYGGSGGVGGAPLFEGYGKGGDGGYTQWGWGFNGNNGYVKIIFKGK